MTNWLGTYLGVSPESEPPPMRLYLDGYDVYLSYQRGSGPSNRHVEYVYDSPEYWDWDYFVYGNDNLAEAKYVYELTG